jgi:hypothetical protein
MAITQEVKIEKIEITKLDSSTYPELHIHESVCFDDPEDNTLPHLTERVRVLKHSILITDVVVETLIAPDVSGEEQIVKDIAAAIWPSTSP